MRKAPINSNKIALLICSYDGAEDLWRPLNETFNKYWRDCPYEIYLGTNHKRPSLKRFIPLCIGDETSWSDNIIKCLGKLKENYILMTFDDVFLKKNIDTSRVCEIASYAITHKWSYLRLNVSPLYDESFNKDIGRIVINRLYRTAAVWAIYKKEVLLELLDPREDAWDFETVGSSRSDKYPDFYASKKQLIPFTNGVIKGKWVPKVFNELKKQGISVSDSNILKMNFYESVKMRIRKIRHNVFMYFVPNSIKVIIKDFFD